MALCINSVEPTLFFKRDGDNFRQLVRVVVEADSEVEATLSVRAKGVEETLPLGSSWKGKTAHECLFPDIRDPVRVHLALLSKGSVAHEMDIEWKPERHWEVSLIHMSHHDWGYTGIPSDVVKEHLDFMDQVLDWCEETENWPADSKFRYLCEQAWSVVPFVENRSAAVVDRLVHYVKQGQIELTALWGNQTTELCGHEELIRLMYPSFRLKREYGIDIVSAVHNDIPGFSWGLVSVLAGAGVKYFNLGVPHWYFGSGERGVHPCWSESEFIPMNIPGPFLWEGPDGRKLFTFYMFHGARSLPEPWESAEEELANELRHLANNGYQYDRVAHMVTGGHRDNAPPTLYLARLAKEWNAKWAYPRLITSTNRQFMGGFEERYGDSLKTFRGELPNTDYTVCACCTPKETGVDRNAHDMLLTAEKLATAARGVSDYDYPQAVLDDAYRNTFNYDLHCWGMYLCGGPAMDASWDEKRGAATRAAALAHDVVVKASNMIMPVAGRA